MTEPSKELVEKMVAFIRSAATFAPPMMQYSAIRDHLGDEARAIVAQLPKPVDPLILRAREIVAKTYGSTRVNGGSIAGGEGPARVEAIGRGDGDDYWEMRCIIAALRHGDSHE